MFLKQALVNLLPPLNFHKATENISCFREKISEIEVVWVSYNYRSSLTGIKSGRSFLIEDGALPWIVQNANNEAAPIRRHIELALCHLAQHGNETLIMFQFFLIHYCKL